MNQHTVAQGLKSVLTKLGQLKPSQLNEMELKILSAFLAKASENEKSTVYMRNHIIRINNHLRKHGKLRRDDNDWVVAYLQSAVDSSTSKVLQAA